MAKRHAKTRVKSNEYTAVITRSSEIDLSFDSASCSTVGDLNFLEIIYVAFTFLTIMAKTTSSKLRHGPQVTTQKSKGVV